MAARATRRRGRRLSPRLLPLQVQQDAADLGQQVAEEQAVEGAAKGQQHPERIEAGPDHAHHRADHGDPAQRPAQELGVPALAVRHLAGGRGRARRRLLVQPLQFGAQARDLFQDLARQVVAAGGAPDAMVLIADGLLAMRAVD
ncbi:hypothetical protein [Pseudoxanthomonas taiwanensis]|uniref:hypothetical protein n=1 Tax=Pseudoxanthomonas taiwanensis TaxID=176598 RepID=UPI0011BDC143|nr:hypothetical protein [Pseudoxanthomonas taiwanensis]